MASKWYVLARHFLTFRLKANDTQAQSFTKRLTIVGIKIRGHHFLCSVGRVLALRWLRKKTPEEARETLALLLPSFACGCVENDDFVSLQEILQQMDVNVGNYDGFTAMHHACQKGKFDMVKYLMSKGATTQIRNRFDCTPLHLAIKNTHHDVIKILKLIGATITLEPLRITMDLIKAVNTADYQLLHAWYLAGVNMNHGDYNGRTALHSAVRNKDLYMVTTLLEYGAVPLVKDIWGRTALDEARINNLPSIFKLFHPRFTDNLDTQQHT